MLKFSKKKALALIVGSFLATFFLSAIIFEGQTSRAQASILDMIRALVTINPLQVSVTAPTEVGVGKTFRVEAFVTNQGEVKIENAQAEIFLPAGLALLKKNQVQEVKVIPAKKDKRAVWSVRGEELGNYGILVAATGVVSGDFISAQSNTVIITVQAAISPPRNNPSIFASLLGFFQNLFNK